MPFVNIQILDDVLGEDVAAKKAKISDSVTTAIAENAGISKDLVWVVFEDVSPREWFVGGKSVENRRKESQ